MTCLDALGYLAAGLVLATFCAKSMLRLRILAIGSNLAFITYAIGAGLWPILLLHAVMLPLNLLRLRQVIGDLSPEPGSIATHQFDMLPWRWQPALQYFLSNVRALRASPRAPWTRSDQREAAHPDRDAVHFSGS